MNPLWIIDLTGTTNVVASFFQEFWEAYKTNSGVYTPPWYYITNAEELGIQKKDSNDGSSLITIKKTIHDIIENHSKLLTVDIGGLKKKIQYPFESSPNVLNVVFVGDISSIYTQQYFHLLAAELRVLLLDEDHKWTNIPNVFFYGMLYRPETVTIGGNLTEIEKVFLHQLHNLSALNINARPYNNILFFQSQESEKIEMIKAMSLSALHLTYGDENVLSHFQKDGNIKTFLSAGVAGVYFEQTVQNQQEAFLLGHTLMDAFINNSSDVFLNKEVASRYVDSEPEFLDNSLSESHILKELISNTDNIHYDKLIFEADVTPGNWSLKKVWKNYYNDFILNLKKDIVNKTRFELLSIEEFYKEKVVENQVKWINEKTKEIEDSVFNVFKSDSPQPQCSLHQASEVVIQCKERITSLQNYYENNKDSGIKISDSSNKTEKKYTPFILTDEYQKALEVSLESNPKNEKGNINEKVVLDQLESQLKTHPVFLLSMLLRALLIGVMLIFTGIPLVKFLSPNIINLELLSNNTYVLGFILFLFPILLYFWRYRSYTQRLKSLKEQYIALSLSNLNSRVGEFLKVVISDSYNQLVEFCDWLKDKRIEEGLRQQLGVISPPMFSFQQNDYFQPLLINNVVISEQSKFLIKPKNISKDDKLKENSSILTSGKFEGNVLLSKTPDFKVKLKESDKKLSELTDMDKMELIRNLMAEKAVIFQSIEEQLDLRKMRIASINDKTLLLDVSGSMSGQPLEQLKKVVKELKENYKDKIRWIAFSNEAKSDTDLSDDLERVNEVKSGGTEYVPAFMKVKEMHDKGELSFDKIVIISDGCPGDVDAALLKAKELGKPVDVIYIGSVGDSGETYLKKIAQETGGQQITVDKASEIEVEVSRGLEIMIKTGDTGNFRFCELLKKGHVEGCAIALQGYGEKIMISAEYSIENILETMGNDAGIKSWFQKSAPTCTIIPGLGYVENKIFFKSTDKKVGKSQTDLFEKRMHPISLSADTNKFPRTPDILASIISVRPLENGLRDLEWCYSRDKDKQIKNGDDDECYKLFESYFSSSHSFVNLHNQKIN